MNRIIMRFFAPDADAGNGGNLELVPDKVSDIVDNFELPRGGGGRRGSKYVNDEILAKIEKMQPKQGITVPFTKDVIPQRNRAALSMVIDGLAKKMAVPEERDGNKVVKAAIPAPKFSVGILKDPKSGKEVCLGVRRDS